MRAPDLAVDTSIKKLGSKLPEGYLYQHSRLSNLRAREQARIQQTEAAYRLIYGDLKSSATSLDGPIASSSAGTKERDGASSSSGSSKRSSSGGGDGDGAPRRRPAPLVTTRGASPSIAIPSPTIIGWGRQTLPSPKSPAVFGCRSLPTTPGCAAFARQSLPSPTADGAPASFSAAAQAPSPPLPAGNCVAGAAAASASTTFASPAPLLQQQTPTQQGGVPTGVATGGPLLQQQQQVLQAATAAPAPLGKSFTWPRQQAQLLHQALPPLPPPQQMAINQQPLSHPPLLPTTTSAPVWSAFQQQQQHPHHHHEQQAVVPSPSALAASPAPAPLQRWLSPEALAAGVLEVHDSHLLATLDGPPDDGCEMGVSGGTADLGGADTAGRRLLSGGHRAAPVGWEQLFTQWSLENLDQGADAIAMCL